MLWLTASIILITTTRIFIPATTHFIIDSKTRGIPKEQSLVGTCEDKTPPFQDYAALVWPARFLPHMPFQLQLFEMRAVTSFLSLWVESPVFWVVEFVKWFITYQRDENIRSTVLMEYTWCASLVPGTGSILVKRPAWLSREQTQWLNKQAKYQIMERAFRQWE